MSIILILIAAALIWLGVDALMLSRHEMPMTRLKKDELMFGKTDGREITDAMRRFAERRYPIASAGSMLFYGVLFIAAGVVFGWWAWSLWI